jgi:hypothetical protein
MERLRTTDRGNLILKQYELQKKNERLLERFRRKTTDEEKAFLERTSKLELILDRFISCLKDNELDRLEFKTFELDNISKITNLSRNEIDQIIIEFTYYRGIHGLMSDRRAKGLSLPNTHHELNKLLTDDRPKFINDIQKIMYKSVKKILGYSSKYIKKEEEKKQNEAMKKRVNTNRFKYKKIR